VKAAPRCATRRGLRARMARRCAFLRVFWRGISAGPGAALFATFCATSATASFMANDFHELSPYVLIGNP